MIHKFRQPSFAMITLFVMTVLALNVQADDLDKVNPEVFGKTYGEWSAEWWKWALAAPALENPVTDSNGEFCAANQPEDKVWFLAGTFGGVVERTCTIPDDRVLFYPLVNGFWFDCPDSPDEQVTEEEVRAILAQFTVAGDNACQLSSTLDGEPLFGGAATSNSISSRQILTARTQSPRFSAILPEGHLLEGACFNPENPDPNFPADPSAGDSGRLFSEGVWVMLPPLSSGSHTLMLHGAGCFEGADGQVQRVFETGVTYSLSVLDDD